MVTPRSLGLAAGVLSMLPSLSSAQYSLTDDSHCNCFVTNGTNSAFFANHVFMDFRNLGQYAGVPSVIDSQFSTSMASSSSGYFTADAWNNMWGIQNWNNSNLLFTTDATVLRINSANNVYIEVNPDAADPSQQQQSQPTYLTLRTVRLPNFQTSAEMESMSKGYRFLSVRMLARTVGDPGACTALFTYRPPPGSSGDPMQVQEADIEFRTRDPPGAVQYTNQPSYSASGDSEIPESTRNVTLPQGKTWGDWAVHRMDWAPGRTSWFVDGNPVADIAFQTPRDASQVVLSSWSDGGVWSGNMSVGGAAYLHVQWLEIIFNSTDGGSSGGGLGHRSLVEEGTLNQDDEEQQEQGKLSKRDSSCKAVCSIDLTNVTGTPVLLYDSKAAPRFGGMVVWGLAGFGVWLPLITMAILLGYSPFAHYY